MGGLEPNREALKIFLQNILKIDDARKCPDKYKSSHPTYSPDLPSGDNYLFPTLKEYLSGLLFSDDDAVNVVQRFLNNTPASWYTMGIQNRPQSLQKYID